MTKGRLEAFSDGVIAIIITIMVLELKVPHGTEASDLLPLVPVFLCYVLSFAYVGIYWNNHHHMLHAAQRVNGRILWANVHLLFWLSLIPFTTACADDRGQIYVFAVVARVRGCDADLNHLNRQNVDLTRWLPAVFHPEFREGLRFWTETDRKVALRVFDLVEASLREPFTEIGKPEPLKHAFAGAWSRRLTQEHRLVYLVRENRVEFLQARYHY